MVRRKLAVLALSLGAFAAACQIVAGIQRTDKIAGPVDASDAPSTPPPPTAPLDPCAHAGPGDLPAADDDEVELPEFLLAVRSLDLIARNDAGTALGYDLDGVCTCDSRPFTADDGGLACAPRKGATMKDQCDDEGGIDNQSTRLFEAYNQPGLDINNSADINNSIANGHQTILISLSKYNGRANDREVTAGIYVSGGLRAQPPSKPGCPVSMQSPDGEWTPTWCGDDAWSIRPDSVFLQTKPLVPLRTGKAFVRDYALTIRVDGAETVVPFGATTVQLGDAIFTGRLVPLATDLTPRDKTRPPTTDEQRLYRLDDGIMAGRMPVHDMLVVTSTFVTPKSDGGHLCTSDLFFLAQQYICQYLDIPASSNQDLNTALPCGALSFAAGFTAFPVLDGDFYTPPPSPNECLPVDGGPPPAALKGVSYDCP